MMSDRNALQPGDRAHELETSGVHDLAGVVSANEAAATLGLSEQEIGRAIRRGELPATRHGRSFQITVADLDAFAAGRGLTERSSPLLRLIEPPAADTEPELPEPIPLFGAARVARITVPSPLTPFVGREREVATLRELLRRVDVRLVTLTGPGGTGKTRLALQAARAVEGAFPDGVVLAPLASVQHPDFIPSAVMQALDLAEGDVLPPAERLLAALRDRELLLILDNFEHLARDPAKRLLVDLLASCPGIKALVTSRTLLHLSGEHAFPVPPLALPNRRAQEAQAGVAPSLDALTQVEAVRLFVDRARAAWPNFALTAENAPAVAEICERVDGLPLAIELAAARSAVLAPAALLERLEQRLPLLTGGPEDQPMRLRTMRSAIGWSYDLLDEETRARFRRLGVFVGGFSLAGAEAVLSRGVEESRSRDEGGEGEKGMESRVITHHLSPITYHPSSSSLLDSLAALLTSSLVQRHDPPDGETRFGMLETVREFALEQLQAAGEEAEARAAHAAYALELVERADPALWSSTNKALLDHLEVEHDNLRAALTRSLAHDPEMALRLASGLGAFWSKRCHWTEGRAWLRRALATGAGEGSAGRAAALGRLGALAGDQADYEEARRCLEESLTLAEELGETQLVARSLRGLGILASNQSDFARAGSLFARALEQFRELDDRPGIARCLNDLGLVAERQGDHDGAIAYQEEAVPIARETGDEWQVCIVLGNLGGAYYDRGDYARGEALSQEALELSRRLGDTFGIAVNLYNLGNCVFQLGDGGGAIVRFRECLSLTDELGERHLASRALDRLGVALHQTGSSRAAARLFGAAAAMRESVGDSLFAEEDASLAARFEEVRSALSAEVYRAAWESGRSLPFSQATAEALSLADAALLAHQTAPARARSGLTVREIEVLRLLADGHPDKEIASRLYISTRTASSHVAAIIAKLGVDSRTAAVAAAFRGGLV
jgi:excisionase family DNA binding protein